MASAIDDIVLSAKQPLFQCIADCIRENPASYMDIAVRYHVSYSTIIKVAKQFGLTRPRGRRPKGENGTE